MCFLAIFCLHSLIKKHISTKKILYYIKGTEPNYTNQVFAEYNEPNTWRELYAPFNNEYRQGTRVPIQFDREQKQIDYMAKREQIVREELDMNRIRCPITNINDPSILYTCSQVELDKVNNETPKSLFTINPDKLN